MFTSQSWLLYVIGMRNASLDSPLYWHMYFILSPGLLLTDFDVGLFAN